jgi:hypothetical protein
VDPRDSLDDVEKRKFLIPRDSNPDPLIVQLVASHYTGYTIPAPYIIYYLVPKLFSILICLCSHSKEALLAFSCAIRVPQGSTLHNTVVLDLYAKVHFPTFSFADYLTTVRVC